MNLRSAVAKTNKRGMLLVFPINNKKEPPSLWYEFFPRTKMRWEWDDEGDSRVADLWHLRERLSCSRQVVYSKWFRGRATLISFELFTAMLALYRSRSGRLGPYAQEILDLLMEDSPLSTKQLKKLSGLQGRSLEGLYTRSLKELWTRGLIVGFGEVDEGAFPSLAVGATQRIFEEHWDRSARLDQLEAAQIVSGYLPKGSAFRKYFDQTLEIKPAQSRAEARAPSADDESVDSL
ncbi:MAG TPA: hypothetical protein VFV50_12165 [Bdellovibrionales bacterium]|nr:hypothetical protein [Bdellovibrionales bacterium]